MSAKSSPRSIRLTDELYAKLCFLAEKGNRSFAREAGRILQEYVDNYEAENGEIHTSEV